METTLPPSASNPEPADRAARVRTRQFNALMRRLPITGGFTLVLVVATMWMFWDVAPRDELLAAGGFALLHSVFSVIFPWLRLRAPHRQVTERDCWAVGLGVSVAAGIDVWLGHAAFVNADAAGRSLVVGAMCGVVVFGGWLLAPLRHAGFGWTLTATLGNVAMLASLDAQAHASLIVLALFAAGVLLVGVHFTERELVARLRAADELASQHELIGLLLHDFEQGASDWLWEMGPDGRLHRLPHRLHALLGAESLQQGGLGLVQLLARVAPAGDGGPDRLARLFAAGEPFQDQVFAVRIDDRAGWWSIKAKPLHTADGQPAGWRGVGSDVTAAQERDLLLARQALEDPLTGLANRHRFTAQLEAVRPGDRLALVLLDLDNFKQVNDSLGHAAGDQLLMAVAQRLSALTPPGALLARLGGDEFAFVMPHCDDPAAIHALAIAVTQALADEVHIDGRLLSAKASLGAALHPTDAHGPDALMQAADQALYAAKADGRGRLRCFEPRLREQAEQRTTLLSDLAAALPEGQLTLQYQPQLSLETGQLVGFEALVRWRHPRRGLVFPTEFIPLAEESGMILGIGEWVLRAACREAMGWPDSLSVAVNVSARELDRGDVVQRVAQVLHDSGLAPSRLELELTESPLLHDTSGAIRVLTSLRALGLRVALDDFGTGFSSLAYLRAFPVDKLKIDRSFVRPIDDPHQALNAAAIVRQVQGLAMALGMRTVAEGVESDAQYGVLHDLGCDVVQGYWLAPPLDAAQARQFITLCQQQGITAARERFAAAAPEPVWRAAPESMRLDRATQPALSHLPTL